MRITDDRQRQNHGDRQAAGHTACGRKSHHSPDTRAGRGGVAEVRPDMPPTSLARGSPAGHAAGWCAHRILDDPPTQATTFDALPLLDFGPTGSRVTEEPRITDAKTSANMAGFAGPRRTEGKPAQHGPVRPGAQKDADRIRTHSLRRRCHPSMF